MLEPKIGCSGRSAAGGNWHSQLLIAASGRQ
jgi:hypothetical protein